MPADHALTDNDLAELERTVEIALTECGMGEGCVRDRVCQQAVESLTMRCSAFSAARSMEGYFPGHSMRPIGWQESVDDLIR